MKKKKLKPGQSIPGCNSYFLCKYLKDTIVQARTYLFCAIRPEVTYIPYTFATLGFAKNASTIKVAPKQANVHKSAAERKLEAELAEMKKLYELQAQQRTVPLEKEEDRLAGEINDDVLRSYHARAAARATSK